MYTSQHTTTDWFAMYFIQHIKSNYSYKLTYIELCQTVYIQSFVCLVTLKAYKHLGYEAV
jgi:hypothetical protein